MGWTWLSSFVSELSSLISLEVACQSDGDRVSGACLDVTVRWSTSGFFSVVVVVFVFHMVSGLSADYSSPGLFTWHVLSKARIEAARPQGLGSEPA